MERFKIVFFRLRQGSNCPDVLLKYQKTLLPKLTITSALGFVLLALASLLHVIRCS